MKTLKYDLDIKWVPGSHLKISDAMSRAPCNEIDPSVSDLEPDSRIMVHTIESSLSITDSRLVELKEMNKTDATLKKIFKCT